MRLTQGPLHIGTLFLVIGGEAEALFHKDRVGAEIDVDDAIESALIDPVIDGKSAVTQENTVAVISAWGGIRFLKPVALSRKDFLELASALKAIAER